MLGFSTNSCLSCKGVYCILKYNDVYGLRMFFHLSSLTKLFPKQVTSSDTRCFKSVRKGKFEVSFKNTLM